MGRIPGRIFTCRFIVCGVVGAVYLGLLCGGSNGQAGSAAKPWTRIEEVGRYSFQGRVLDDKNLSGVALISDRFGLIGADEAREVQVVELSRQAGILRVMATVPLVRSGDEIDIEAIAAEGDCYYIVGSHGVSKKKGDFQSNRYKIFRLKVNRATGRPGESAVPEVATLADLLRSDPVLGPHFAEPLQQGGVNIEGLAVRAGRLFVGLRSPNVQGDAFVLEVRADDVFSGRSRPSYTRHRLHLGTGLGIRDMVTARTGFLILAGNSASEPSKKYTQSADYDEDREFSLFTWDGQAPEVHRIGPLPDVKGKAEAMTVLEETTDYVTMLVLFDGPKQGRPTVYRIS